MNRIYQGRVSKVQTLKPGCKGTKPEDWDDMADGEECLWRHHELFQDAVNYYIVALLSLASDKTSDIYKLRERMTDAACETYQVWTSFRRRGTTRRGMRDSVAQYLCPNVAEPSFEACARAVLEGNEASSEIRDLALKLLLVKLDGDGAIKTGSKSYAPRFYNPDNDPTWDYTTSALQASAGRSDFRRRLFLADNDRELDVLAERFGLECEVKLQPGAKALEGDVARAKLLESVQHFAKCLTDESFRTNKARQWLASEWTSADLQAATEEIGNLSPGIPANRGGNINVDILHGFLLFKYVPKLRPKAAAFLRQCIPNPTETEQKAARRAVKESKTDAQGINAAQQVDEACRALGDDPIRLARGSRGYVFRAFTSLQNWQEGRNDARPIWSDFDIAAFKEALKSLHQVESKGRERAKEAAKKQARVDYQTKADAKWKGGGEQEEARPPKLIGDPRIERLKQLQDELGDEYEMAEGQRVKYGLQARTIRGIHDLRKQWIKIVKPGDAFTKERYDRVLGVLREYQVENPEVVGSVRLFETLLEERNWLIWQEPTLEQQHAWRTKAGLTADAEFAKEPVQALTDALELEEEVKRLKEPVKLTPADAEHSRRQFYFNEVCDLTKKGRLHAAERTLTVPVAVASNGFIREETMRLHFGAARMLRDDLAPDAAEEVRASRWQQPMMEALGVASPLMDKGKAVDLASCVAVALMPDVVASGERRVLLNFPVTLDEAPVQTALGKAALWAGQFGGADGEHYWLRWPSTWTEKSKATPWWKQVKEFTALAVDLGQRDAGAFAVIKAEKSPTQPEKSRLLGTDGEGQLWSAGVQAMGLMRLPGEDAKVWRDGQYQSELYGERGRSASEAEWTEARKVCESLGLEADKVLGSDSKHHSFPELNDRLLFGLRRAQSHLAKLQSWSAVATDETRRSRVQREIVADADDPLGLKPFVEASQWEAVTTALIPEIERLRVAIRCALEIIANRVLPLRGRRWEWALRSDNSGCHVLRQTARGTDREDKLLGGQRGLSMERLEQMEELRRRCLSLNRALLQTPGVKPVLGSRTKGSEVPDPCPEVLEKMEALREQRVNQTAHLVLAQALGLRLRAPQKDKALRQRQDVHGEYEKISGRRPVDFIVMEDLGRYLASQGRARSENSRLMKWCHRQILGKLKQLCEVYGIPVLETPAAYSSRFCSRTGVAGFRAVDLTPEAANDFRWKKHLLRLEAEAQGEKPKGKKVPAESHHVKALLEQLQRINADIAASGESRPKWRTLLAPVAGGPLFVPMRGKVTQADMNAAINLGFRAIAAPDNASIHVRLRSERKGERFQVRADNTREKARWKELARGIDFLPADVHGAKSLLVESHPNFFADLGSVATFDRATVGSLRVASGRGLWRTVNDRDWFTVNRLNNDRLEKWGYGRPLNEGTAMGTVNDPNDEIPI